MTPAEYFDAITEVFQSEGWFLDEMETGFYTKVANCGICEECLGLAKLKLSATKDDTFVLTSANTTTYFSKSSSEHSPFANLNLKGFTRQNLELARSAISSYAFAHSNTSDGMGVSSCH